MRDTVRTVYRTNRARLLLMPFDSGSVPTDPSKGHCAAAGMELWNPGQHIDDEDKFPLCGGAYVLLHLS